MKKTTPKYVKNTQIVAAMGHPGGGRTAISSRTLHCFHLLNVCMPSDSQLRKIFGSIAASHLLNFDEDIKPLAEVMTTATLEIYTYMVAELLPTPEKPHGELVEPEIVSTATRAAEDLEKLQARFAKANKVAAAAKASPK